MKITVDGFNREMRSRVEEARRQMGKRGAHVLAQMAAKGALDSGGTIKLLIQAGVAIERETLAAILADLDKARASTGARKGDAMARLIAPQMEALHDEISTLTGLGRRLEVAGSAATAAAGELLEEGWHQVQSDLKRYERGFSRAEGKAWTERHPVWWETVKIGMAAVGGAAVTLIVQGLGG